MAQTQKLLEKLGFSVIMPKDFYNLANNEAYMESDEERITVKIEYDFIREHFRKIQQADAILVLNHDKKGIKNYIGGNTFLEMGVAFWLDKKYFFSTPFPRRIILPKCTPCSRWLLPATLPK